ncbi:MAG: prohibitin family protein [Acidobacteria bacterium]|nr:prohibitin family protein [Acidobacteriota bacterium]
MADLFDDGPKGLRDFKLPSTGGIFKKFLTTVAVFFLLILTWASLAYVPAGHIGVLTLFGAVTGKVLPEGTHLANPFAVNNILSVRTQEIKEVASVPSKEGLIITLEASLLFRLDQQHAAQVYQTIGNTYVDTVLNPNFRSAIRGVTSAHSANALYSGEREQVAQAITQELRRGLENRGIIIESVLLRDVQLPLMLKQSIEAKQQAEQDSLRMSFILQKEKQEADRKRIEAQGIADFQRTISAGLSSNLLTWKGIEATEKLANSQNSKVVVIGATKGGLPLILNSE